MNPSPTQINQRRSTSQVSGEACASFARRRDEAARLLAGLHYSTNKSQPIWQSLKWSACCQAFTFPEGVATTVAAASSTSTSGGNGVLNDLDSSTFTFILYVKHCAGPWDPLVYRAAATGPRSRRWSSLRHLSSGIKLDSSSFLRND